MCSNRYKNFLKTLSAFRERFIKGEIINKDYYQFKLLSSILKYYEMEFNKIKPERLKTKYKSVFIFLPSNIPIEFLQFMNLIYTYDLKAFFKIPSRDNKFIKKFFEILNDEKIKAEFSEHKIAIETAKGYDFIIGSGTNRFETVIKSLNKPSKFFGPKFSFAISENSNIMNMKNIIKDFLSFDTEGCLSTRFLFTFDKIDFNLIDKLIKEQRELFPPQKSFDKNSFEYYSEINLFYSERFIINETEAVFEINDIPEYFPQRTLYIKRVKSYNDISDFLKDIKDSVQSITTATGEKINFFEENSSVSIFLPFGKSQFPPLGWMFERDLNIRNFFD